MVQWTIGPNSQPDRRHWLMVLDAKFAELRQHFQVRDPADWCRYSPQEILAIDNIGPQTLNHLRLHLANQGLTLRGDQTPAYWQSHLSIMRGTSQIADNQGAITVPFTILIDTAEQQPFTFAGLRADANQDYRPLIVPTRREHLGPTHGDYTVAELQGHVHIERKSQSDVVGTVLGWGDRREQFQRTLQFLAEIPSSAVIVECSLGAAIQSIESRGKKSAAENRKIFLRQVNAWHDDYRVPWVFCDNRRLAEISTFRWLQRRWRHLHAERKRAEQTAREFESLGL